jgi:outer membrane autotransporter protein
MSDPTADAQAPDRVVADESAGTTEAPTDAQALVDRLIRELQHGLRPEDAVYMVAVLANRSAAELHRLAKAQSTATKGTPAWGTWASWQNGARRLVLDATSARENAATLAGRKR